MQVLHGTMGEVGVVPDAHPFEFSLDILATQAEDRNSQGLRCLDHLTVTGGDVEDHSSVNEGHIVLDAVLHDFVGEAFTPAIRRGKFDLHPAIVS